MRIKSPRNFDMNCDLVERIARRYEMEYGKLQQDPIEPCWNDALASRLRDMSHEEFEAFVYSFLKCQHEAGLIGVGEQVKA